MKVGDIMAGKVDPTVHVEIVGLYASEPDGPIEIVEVQVPGQQGTRACRPDELIPVGEDKQ